jgi:membrane protease YdiL (CAAX protease family)
LAKIREAQESLRLFDDYPPVPPEATPDSRESSSETPPGEPSPQLWIQPAAGGAPVAALRTPYHDLRYPADLQISWSWPHLILFLLFAVISLTVIQGVLMLFYAPHQSMSPQQLETYLLSKPQFTLGSMVIWYAAIFFFLYVTLSLLRGHSFWECLGWRKITSRPGERARSPIAYFFAGCGLSLFVAILSSRLKAPDNSPMEELFKNRQTALLFVAMAVVIAPLVEETLFRGYLYPLFARSFGITPGIVLTGVLFGMMHGAQLGWTWGLVAMLILVGIVFTWVRARTGSVFASFLMHLGYNSLISVAALIGTHGFTQTPVGK